MSRRLFVALLLAVLATSPLAAWSKQGEYTPEILSAAVSEGRVIVLDFHAGWCPTCRQQKSVLNELGDEPALQEAVLIVVDFDSAAELKKKYAVSSQSTLVVLAGEHEVARSVGTTSKDEIRALIAKAF